MTGRTKEVDHAINVLRDFDTVSTYEKYWGIVENYILSLEEQKPCEDFISRQYLVEKAVSWDKHFTDSERYVSLTDIQNAPPVMREATQEEREGVDQYIDSIAEHCEDCISRQLVDEIKELMTDINGDTVYAARMSDIRQLPPVKPGEKVGRWEWVQYDGNPNIGNWHCSECRTIIPHMPEETNNTPIYKWCPMCGAKMQKCREEMKNKGK